MFGEDGYTVPGHASSELPQLGYQCVWEDQGHQQARTDGEGGTTTTSTSESDVENHNDSQDERGLQADKNSTSSVTTRSSQTSKTGDANKYPSSISTDWGTEEYDSSDSGMFRTRYVL